MSTDQRDSSGWGFRTENGPIEGTPSAVFPIVKANREGVSVVGTGFYISSHGLFVSAKHCFQRPDGLVDLDASYASIHMLGAEGYILRALAWCQFVADADVAIGAAAEMRNKLGEPLPTQALTISAERPVIGTEIVTYAYANTTVVVDGEKSKINLKPRFYEGKLIRYFPIKRDSSTITWPCYETSMPIYRAASGGPVCRGDSGAAFAVNTSSIENSEDISFVTPLDFILDTEIDVQNAPDGKKRRLKIRDLIEEGVIASSVRSVPRD